MSKTISLEMLEAHRALIDVLYDSFKVIDPETKRVMEFRDGRPQPTEKYCYDRWKRDTPCENCISFTSKSENCDMVRLFSADGCAYFVRALPVEGTEPPLVVEFLKDVTNSLFYSAGGSYGDEKYILDAVSNLDSLVIRDQLTKLYNRRYLDTRLPADIHAAVERKTALSVIFIDVDNFKHINDTYGHATGDLVLQATAEALQSCIGGDGDWAARFGGDEFVVCLTDTDSSAARRIAEHIREAIGTASVPFGTETIRFTVSAGIETMSGTARTAKEMLDTADRNMYSAKHCGKNCVTAGHI